MILISSSTFDVSTNKVIDWILSIDYEQKIIRVNDDSNYQIKFDKKDIIILIDETAINIESIKSFWYRRGRIRYKLKDTVTFNTNIKEDEEKVLEEYINFVLKKKRHINDYFNSEPNKLIVLEEAKKIGFSIPESYVCQDRESVLKINYDKEIITKTFLGPSMILFEDKTSVIYTEIISKKNIPKYFSPSLFQDKIEKKYELRIFYFDGKFWSMAIFSQLDSKTSVDFKQYKHENPNRTVPYKLPKNIEMKLKKLILKLQYNCCSIDMIVTLKNEFVFLEINPIGQFGMISIPCNYHFEKEIANFLMYES